MADAPLMSEPAASSGHRQQELLPSASHSTVVKRTFIEVVEPPPSPVDEPGLPQRSCSDPTMYERYKDAKLSGSEDGAEFDPEGSHAEFEMQGLSDVDDDTEDDGGPTSSPLPCYHHVRECDHEHHHGDVSGSEVDGPSNVAVASASDGSRLAGAEELPPTCVRIEDGGELSRLVSENTRLALENRLLRENMRLALENQWLAQGSTLEAFGRRGGEGATSSTSAMFAQMPGHSGPWLLSAALGVTAPNVTLDAAASGLAGGVPEASQPSTGRHPTRARGGRVGRESAIPPREEQSDLPPELRTTLMMRNLPNNYSRAMVLAMLDDEGFAGKYDFLYLPIDFKSRACLGYAFVNLVRPEFVTEFWKKFHGFSRWVLPSRKVCGVSWSGPHQGLEAHIERYRNSPVMHDSVLEEFKPAIFANGKRVPFPAPVKAIRPPRVRYPADSKGPWKADGGVRFFGN